MSFSLSFLRIFHFFYFLKTYLFTSGCAGSSLLCSGFLQLWRVGAALHGGPQVLGHTGSAVVALGLWGTRAQQLWLLGSGAQGLSSCGSRAPGHTGSAVMALGLQQLWLSGSGTWVSSCGFQAQLLHGVWGLPRPGIEPAYHVLAGGFFTTR